MICVDANILIAAIDARDVFHLAASATLIEHGDIVALNVTWAEALVHPYRLGKANDARQLLDDYGVELIPVTDPIAFGAAELRATHGNRNFPMLDALVVAAGIETGARILTTDTKWPSVPDAEISVLTPIAD